MLTRHFRRSIALVLSSVLALIFAYPSAASAESYSYGVQTQTISGQTIGVVSLGIYDGYTQNAAISCTAVSLGAVSLSLTCYQAPGYSVYAHADGPSVTAFTNTSYATSRVCWRATARYSSGQIVGFPDTCTVPQNIGYAPRPEDVVAFIEASLPPIPNANDIPNLPPIPNDVDDVTDLVYQVQGIVHVGDVMVPEMPDPDGVSATTGPSGGCRMNFKMTNDKAGNAYRTAPQVDVDWYFTNGVITSATQQNSQWRNSGYRLTSVDPKGQGGYGGETILMTAQYNYQIDAYYPSMPSPHRTVQLRIELTRAGNRCAASGSWNAYSW